MRNTLAAVSLFTLCAVSTGAAAESLNVPVRTTDLATEQAVSQLYERIVAAANTVCAKEQAQVYGTFVVRARCVAPTVETAVEKAGLPALTSYHAAQVEAGASKLASAQ